MIKCLRDIWTVARHELLDSVRGKRFAVVLLIYIAGAMLACNACISVLHRLENQISETLMLSASSSPGAVTDALMKSKSFQRMVIELVKDREVAMELLEKHVYSIEGHLWHRDGMSKEALEKIQQFYQERYEQ